MTMQLSEKQQKDGWQIVRFGEIAKEVKSTTKNPIEDGLEFYIGLDHLDPQSLRIQRRGLIAEDNPSFTRCFKPGQILFGKRRAYQKKAAVADFKGICSGDIIVIEAIKGKIIPELLPFIVQSDMFFDWAIKTSSGSLSPRTKWKALAEFEFPLPPLERQKEILEAMNKNESVKIASEQLQKITSIAKRAIISGYFRDAKKHKAVKDVTLNDILAKEKNALVDGPFGSNLKTEHYRTRGVPVIQSGFVTSGQFLANSYVYIEHEYFEKVKRSKVRPGDIVMAKIGEYCGKCAVLPDVHEISVLAGNSLKITVDDKVCLRDYLKHYLHYYYEKTQFRGVKSETAQPAISLKALRKLKIILPELDKQKKIVEMLNAFDEFQNILMRKVLACRSIQKSFLVQELSNEL